jgi:metallo-beta-lactamase class B
MRLSTWHWLFIALGIAVPVATVGFVKWHEAIQHGGQQPAEPFNIAGNLYYVGFSDVACFLLTGPDGHVLIDGGYPLNPALIVESIARLGFDIKDVIDRTGYQAYIDKGESAFRSLLAEQQEQQAKR